MRKGVSCATLFHLLSHIIETPVFLEYRNFEDTLLLQINVILAFKNVSKCPETDACVHWKCSLSPHTFLFKGFAN